MRAALTRVMTTELRFLAASVILGLVHLIVDSHLISFQYGYRWTASSREQPAPPLRGVANRVDQAYTNFMETFPLFAAVVLVAHLGRPPQRAHPVGGATLFLGEGGLRPCRCDWPRTCSLNGLLQHGAGRDPAVSRCTAALRSGAWIDLPNGSTFDRHLRGGAVASIGGRMR